MPKPARRAARLQRSASRLRRIAAAIRPDTDAAPVHELRRRLPSGRTVPASETGRTWLDVVGKPAPHNKVGLGARVTIGHPSRKHDVRVPDREFVVENPPSVPRWERRAHTRAVAAENARRAKASKPAFRLPITTPGASRSVRRWADFHGAVIGFADEHGQTGALLDLRAVFSDVQQAHKVAVGEHHDKAVARQMTREAVR